MPRKTSLEDRDSIIIRVLENLGRDVSPRQLRKECQKQGLSRSSYFRGLKKLKKIMLIEENHFRTDNERTTKVYNRVHESQLADPRGIDQYIREMESSDQDIRNRGFRDLSRMCKSRRVAWYFSTEHSSRFRNGIAVREFFEKRLLNNTQNSPKWLALLDDIVGMETPGSVWKHNLYEYCKEILWRIAWRCENFDQRRKSIQILRRFPGSLECALCWAFHVIKDISYGDEANFAKLKDVLPSILFDVEGKKRKYLIREKLNELTLQSGRLRQRISFILKNVQF